MELLFDALIVVLVFLVLLQIYGSLSARRQDKLRERREDRHDKLRESWEELIAGNPSADVEGMFESYDGRSDTYTKHTYISESAARRMEKERLSQEAQLKARQLKALHKSPAPVNLIVPPPAVSRHLSDGDISNIVSSNTPIIASMTSHEQEKSLQDWHQANVGHYGPYIAQEILTKVQARLRKSK